MQITLRFPPIVLAALAFACSSGPEVPADYDTQAIAKTLAEAQCRFNARCQPATFQFLKWGDEAGCVAKVSADYVRILEFDKPIIAAGRASYERDHFQDCVSAYDDADCDLGPDDGACMQIVVGAQDEGSICFSSDECSSDTFCARTEGLGSCGVCQARARRNESCANAPCTNDSACADLAQAQSEQSDPRCVPADAGENATCGDASSGFCRGNLVCVGSASPGVCLRPAKLGESCDPEEVAMPSCNTAQSLGCEAGMCQTATWGGAGTACGSTSLCDVDSYCADGAGMCTALPSGGQSCRETNGFCRDGFYCGEAGECIAQKQSGGTCEFSDECSGDLLCVGTSCAAFVWMQCN